MQKFHLLAAASIAASLMIGSAQAQTKASSGTSEKTKPAAEQASDPNKGTAVTIPLPVIIMVPLEFRADPNLANGCWVRLFNGENFKGNDELTIVGPVDLQTLKMPSGVNWKRKAESLIAGPKATVTVYENEFFRDKTVTYTPGQKVDSLRKSLGILHAIDSMKVACPAK